MKKTKKPAKKSIHKITDAGMTTVRGSGGRVLGPQDLDLTQSELEIDADEQKISAMNFTLAPTIQKSPRIINPSLGYQNNGGIVSRPEQRRHVFEPTEYDLFEIGRIEDVEAYVRQAFKKQVGLFLKEGFDYVGSNKSVVKYLKSRFAQIERATSIPHEELIRRIVSSLIRKSNAFLVKVRSEEASGGRIRTNSDGIRVLPVAGYYIIPAETMQAKTDGSSKPYMWRQMLPNGTHLEYQPEDIVHIHFDRKEGFIFGTPLIQPVIDDIRALRKIEENIELLIYKHLFPVFQYVVGTDAAPAGITEDGMREIDIVKMELMQMPTEGGIVTPERHEIRSIGSESKALRAESYLLHFKQRVFAGLGMSSVDFGDADCYDPQTETLTESGWKFHHQIDHINEKIATFNPETKKIEFNIANYKFEGNHTGDMISFQGKHIDINVTPRHDMYIKPRSSDLWKKVKAHELYEGLYSEFYMMENAEFENTDTREFFHLDAAKRIRGRDVNPINCELKDWASFIGWFVSEGCIDKHNGSHGAYRTLLSQKNGPKLDRICSLLNNAEFSYSISYAKEEKRKEIASIKIYGKTLYKYLEANIGHGAYNKNLPTEVMQWPKDARAALLDTLLDGDGTRDKRINRRNVVYYTVSKQLADDVQILAMSLGHYAKVKLTKQSADAHGDFIYRVMISYNRNGNCFRSIKKEMISKQAYNGLVYCYNVPNHLFVTRRNGKVTIQGNTATRSTSDNMSRALIDNIKDLQDSFEAQFNLYVINELLEESTFGAEVLLPENLVKIEFREVDIDKQIKMETHAMDMFLKDGITWDELRKDTGRDPIEIPDDPETQDREQYPEWFRTAWKLFREPEKLINAGDESYSSIAMGAANSVSTGVAPSDVKNAQESQSAADIKLAVAKEKAKPRPIVRKKDNFLRQDYKDMEELVISELSHKSMVSFDYVQQKLNLAAERMKNSLTSQMNVALLNGIGRDSYKFPAKIQTLRNNIQDRSAMLVRKLTQDIISMLRSRVDTQTQNVKISTVRLVFDALEYRIDFIVQNEIARANNLGKIIQVRESGATKAKYLVEEKTCDSCKQHSLNEVHLEHYTLETVPPHHPNCNCGLQITEVISQ